MYRIRPLHKNTPGLIAWSASEARETAERLSRGGKPYAIIRNYTTVGIARNGVVTWS